MVKRCFMSFKHRKYFSNVEEEIWNIWQIHPNTIKYTWMIFYSNSFKITQHHKNHGIHRNSRDFDQHVSAQWSWMTLIRTVHHGTWGHQDYVAPNTFFFVSSRIRNPSATPSSNYWYFHVQHPGEIIRWPPVWIKPQASSHDQEPGQTIC